MGGEQRSRNSRIALIDLETAPNLAYTWGKYQQDVIAFERESFLMSYAYKWLGERMVHCLALCDLPGYEKNRYSDKALVKELWKVFNEADTIIAHNGDKFDVKKAQGSMWYNGITPPSPFKTIDTRKVMYKEFRENSNKLDDACRRRGIGGKLKHPGFPMWLACMAGDKAAWAKMKRYNIQDVKLLEALYLDLRPWIRNHPRVSSCNLSCTRCGSERTAWEGFIERSGRRIRQYSCKSCGGWLYGASVRISDNLIPR